MKTLFFLITGLLSASIHAQIVTLRFENSLNNYEVKVDGRSYFSKDLSNDSRKQKSMAINDLAPGTHRLDVYSITDNNSNTGTAMYSNTFQLREGYDMVIAIKRNEQVAFTERRSVNTTSVQQRDPISEIEFDKLQKSISAKWSQSARFTAARTAINTPTNYFTTEQVGQLLSLLTGEAKKVELAKLAYHKTTDPNNFSEISSLFNSQASRDEMEKYINNSSGTVTTNNDNARPAISISEFNSLMRTVRNQYQQEGKVAVLTDAFNNKDKYFTTSQLQQLISLVTAENNRLSLAKLSYARVSDINNFSSLNNLFTKQSSRDELSYFVKHGTNPASTEVYTNRTPMPDAEFRKLLQKASLHFRQSSVVGDVKTAFNTTTNYYTIAQTRSLLNLVSAESDRLALAKLAYHRSAEPQAFTQLFDLFSSEASKNALSNYINSVAINE